jgi:hypothetical protein
MKRMVSTAPRSSNWNVDVDDLRMAAVRGCRFLDEDNDTEDRRARTRCNLARL